MSWAELLTHRSRIAEHADRIWIYERLGDLRSRYRIQIQAEPPDEIFAEDTASTAAGPQKQDFKCLLRAHYF